MKGKSTFITGEIDELKHLINKKNSLPSDEQKAIRDQMRAMDFYITDFTSSTRGFESSDLDGLIKSGVIKIVDSSIPANKNNEVAKINENHQERTPLENKSILPFDQAFLEKHNFTQHITYSEYKYDHRAVKIIPEIKGLYIVFSTSLRKDFLTKGTGGFFKDKNPNVPIKVLSDNWVDNTNILYIGRAGGVSENGVESNSTLRRRLNTYFKFGLGEPVGHWGGRFIWQLKYSDELIFYWHPCDETENPVTLEHHLITEYKKHYGSRPFANLKD